MADAAHQIILALVFLTRLPLGRLLPARVMPLSDAVWAFPVAGAVIGALAGWPLLLPAPPLVAAALSLALLVWLTGALHEDGLADFADAGGARDPGDRLRIMRDPLIGSYGVMALIVTAGLRVAALTVVGPWVVIAAVAGGRAAAGAVMWHLPPARADGLGRGAGRPRGRQIAVGVAIAVVCAAPAAVAAPWAAALAWLSGGAVLIAVIRRARRLIGGQTGDVLGAAALLVETAMLTGHALIA